jgi:methylthioribose-1-phosphate isomerase
LQTIANPDDWKDASRSLALEMAREDIQACREIGRHGVKLIRDIHATKQPGMPINLLTHCNAGWLAFVDYGSAISPIYQAFAEKIPIHVWVDETRPRCQGSSLTAWELGKHGVPHTVIADNTGGHLMQHSMVDMVITGADRVTYTGDVANKIGTYLKALAAFDNQVPFYVAFPSSTFDWEKCDGIGEIPIEERGSDEVNYMEGKGPDGSVIRVRVVPEGTRSVNFGFDVTPNRLVSGLITERGICKANSDSVFELYPERKDSRKQMA